MVFIAGSKMNLINLTSYAQICQENNRSVLDPDPVSEKKTLAVLGLAFNTDLNLWYINLGRIFNQYINTIRSSTLKYFIPEYADI